MSKLSGSADAGSLASGYSARRVETVLPGTAYHRYRACKYFKDLDGLRFLCIAMVLWHHSQPASTQDLLILSRGFLGVDFFFVLSGYLITTLLLREEEQYGSFSIRNFYIRRALRILPVYFFVVTVVSLYFILIQGERQYLQLLPFYYGFLSNFLVDHIPTLSITWSLAVEEQFYVLWPLLLILVPRRMLIWLAAILVLLNVTGSMGWWGDSGPHIGPLQLRLPDSTYAPILLGSVAAILLHQRRSFELLNAALGHRASAFVSILILFALMLYPNPEIRGLPSLAIHIAMTCVIVSLVLRSDNWLTPVLGHAAVIRVGVVSYGIYLYHLVALDVVTRIAALFDISSAWLLLLAYSLLSYVMAEVSFRTLEAYFRRFRPAKLKPTQ